jgi:uncharacterized protein (DUF362 family)/Pyruvate/2-oxoacid:ferredoxin oxidoreductase delta subunit
MNSKSKSIVALVRCDDYEENMVHAAVEKAIDILGGIGKFVSKGDKILLKPNVLFGGTPDRAITTHPSVLTAVARIAREAGAILSFGDSSGFGKPETNFRKAGLLEAGIAAGAALADFEKGEIVHFPGSPFTKQFTIASGVLAADGIISLPKMKTHGFLRMTGAVKNQFGCIPGFLKPRYHVEIEDPANFARMLVSLNLLLAPRLYIMDAVVAMEGNGPGGGDPVAMNAILASDDPVALDTVMCRLAALDPLLVPTNIAGEELGLGTCMLDRIEIEGDPIEEFVDSNFRIERKHACGTRNLGFFNSIKSAFLQKPVIDASSCVKCGICVSVCPIDPKVLAFSSSKNDAPPRYDYARCIRCFCCQEVCPEKAIRVVTPLLARLALPGKPKQTTH